VIYIIWLTDLSQVTFDYSWLLLMHLHSVGIDKKSFLFY